MNPAITAAAPVSAGAASGATDPVEMASGGAASPASVIKNGGDEKIWRYISIGLVSLTFISLAYSVIYYHRSLTQMKKDDTDLKTKNQDLENRLSSIEERFKSSNRGY